VIVLAGRNHLVCSCQLASILFALFLVVKRSAQLVLLKKVARKTSGTVRNALIKLMEPYENAIHTMTLDNGKEFATHTELTEKLGTKVFFAGPYSS